tara:strand:- start:3861 stop:4103 length:243 start_codon:yes stop_codon:yes gene_type:complete
MFVEFVDHEPHHAILMLRNHADAVALPQTADEVFFHPRGVIALEFDGEYLGKVSVEHPADVRSDFHGTIIPTAPSPASVD